MAKGVKIRLDKKRHLLITTESLAAYERVTGRQMMAQSTLTNLSLRDVIVMAWAFLLHEDSRLTIDQVGDMIKPQKNFNELLSGIQRAMDDFTKELDR